MYYFIVAASPPERIFVFLFQRREKMLGWILLIAAVAYVVKGLLVSIRTFKEKMHPGDCDEVYAAKAFLCSFLILFWVEHYIYKKFPKKNEISR